MVLVLFEFDVEGEGAARSVFEDKSAAVVFNLCVLQDEASLEILDIVEVSVVATQSPEGEILLSLLVAVMVLKVKYNSEVTMTRMGVSVDVARATGAVITALFCNRDVDVG